MADKALIYDFSLEELESILMDWGEPKYRAKQIWEGLYQQYWHIPTEFTNIPKTLQEKLNKQFSFRHLTPEKTLTSSDGETTKTLLKLPDGAAIEAVLMSYDKRQTLCISTQVGCAVGCKFCATGQMGFSKHLSSGEIVEQVLYYARLLKSKGKAVTNIVYMGMGEPFLNYDATMSSISRLNDSSGFNLGARRFTISTAGIVPKIKQFAEEKSQVNLAISLHAADDPLRSSMMPINKKYPIDALIRASREYVQHTNRRITFEWALVNKKNDTPEQANKLAGLLQGLNCHVSLIPLNPTTGYQGQRTLPHRVEKFRKILEENHIPCTVRVRRGIDIQAGCGQLASES